MKKEFKRISKFSKKIIAKENYKKIKKIKDLEEKINALKYTLYSKVHLEYLELENNLEKLKQKNLIAESKLKRLDKKIKFFKLTYAEEDYKLLEKLIQDIKTEIERSQE